jgi:MFS family permease
VHPLPCSQVALEASHEQARLLIKKEQIFFVGYILFEIPSNIVIRRVGPAIWLSCIALAWGALSLGIGFVDSWQALTAIRAFLGVLEAVGAMSLWIETLTCTD